MEMEEHYDNLTKQLLSGKDSIFEPCKIISFDPKTLTAHVFFTRSSREKEDAVVLFPAMSYTSAMIFVPTPNTTALAFWGPDRQVFIMPTQYILPNYNIDRGVATQNASLTQFDKDLSLEHLEAGEFFNKAHGSTIYQTSAGDIEFMTERMDFLRLETDGVIRGGFDGHDFLGPMFVDKSELITVEGMLGQRKTTQLFRETPELVANDPRLIGPEIVQLLAMTTDPDSLAVIPEIPNDELFTEVSGVVTEDQDGVSIWKRLSETERVVKELRVGHGTISIGENGSIRLAHEGFTLDVAEDVALTFDEKTYPLKRLIDRVEQLSRLAGIEEGLHDA